MRKKMLLLVSKRRVETSVLVADYIEPVLLCAGKNYTKICTIIYLLLNIL